MFLTPLLASTAALAPPGASAQTYSESAGASCLVAPASSTPLLCMVGTMETDGWECGHYYLADLEWGCTPHYTLSFTVPANQCAVAKIGPSYIWDVCVGGVEQTFIMEDWSAWVYAWETTTISVDLCLGTTSLNASQCARWLHTSGPAPYDPVDPTHRADPLHAIDSWVPEAFRALREDGRAPAGAGVTVS